MWARGSVAEKSHTSAKAELQKKAWLREGCLDSGSKPQKAGGWEKAESRRLAFIGTPIFAGKATAQNKAIIIYESNLPCQAFLQKKCHPSAKAN